MKIAVDLWILFYYLFCSFSFHAFNFWWKAVYGNINFENIYTFQSEQFLTLERKKNPFSKLFLKNSKSSHLGFTKFNLHPKNIIRVDPLTIISPNFTVELLIEPKSDEKNVLFMEILWCENLFTYSI